MPQLVTVAQDDEIAEGAVKVVEAGGKRIALCKFNGSVYAIDDVCTHDRGPLDQGELITIPALPDIGDWEKYDAARKVLGPNLSRKHSAARYGISA